jgi:hypothetical protein
MKQNQTRYVRDFELPCPEVGDWVVSNSMIVGQDTPPILFNAWGALGFGPLPPGTLITYQLVLLPPFVNGAPQITSAVIDSIQCDIMEVPVGAPLVMEGGLLTTVVSPTGVLPLSLGANVTIPAAVSSGSLSLGTPTNVALWGANFSDNTVIAPFPVALGGTLNVTNLSTQGAFCGSGISPAGPIIVGINLYGSRYNSSTNSWMVYDPLDPLTACRDDQLDIRADSYLQPNAGWGHTGRRWSVSLPYPIRIVCGQALHVTFSVAASSDPGGVPIVAFIRSRVCDVG